MGMVTGSKSVWHAGNEQRNAKLSPEHQRAMCSVQRKLDAGNLFIISFSFFSQGRGVINVFVKYSLTQLDLAGQQSVNLTPLSAGGQKSRGLGSFPGTPAGTYSLIS